MAGVALLASPVYCIGGNHLVGGRGVVLIVAMRKGRAVTGDATDVRLGMSYRKGFFAVIGVADKAG